MREPVEPFKNKRPWGYFQTLHRTDGMWIKILTIAPQQCLSLQYHDKRVEHWTALDIGVRATIGDETLDLTPGLRYTVPVQTAHRLSNPYSAETLRVLEVAVGEPDEDDIVRLSDKYGRVRHAGIGLRR